MEKPRPRPRIPGSPNPLAKRKVEDPMADRSRFTIPPPLATGSKEAFSRSAMEIRRQAAKNMKKGDPDEGS